MPHVQWLSRIDLFKACSCGKGAALGLAVVAIEARPLNPEPFERAEALAVTARAVTRNKGEDEGDKYDRETQPVPDVIQHAGAVTRELRTTKNPPWGRARKTKRHLQMLWTQLWRLRHDATIRHACYVKRNVPKRTGFTHQKSPCNAGAMA